MISKACARRRATTTQPTSLAILIITFLLIAASSCSLLLFVGASLPFKIDLNEKSYSLRAELVVFQNDKKAKSYTIEEMHSYEQKRSRIDFETESVSSLSYNPPGKKVILATEAQAFYIEYEQRKCERLQHVDIDKTFQLNFISSPLGSTSYVTGMARLLMFIEKNTEKFVKSNDGSSYVYGKKTFDPDDVRLQVDYVKSEASVGSGVALPLGVPSKITIERANYQILVRFKRVTMLPRSEIIYSDSGVLSAQHGFSGGSSSEALQFDVFAIERGMGCSSFSIDKDYHEELADMRAYRFSFDARVNWIYNSRTSVPIQLIVGYEPQIETLRVDRVVESRLTQTLVSFKHDRSYHILKRRAAHDTLLDTILKVQQNDQLDNDVSCVIAKVDKANKISDISVNRNTLGEMLLGAKKLLYLGYARVRGIDAYVFEAHDTRAPIWFEQPVIYQAQDSEGRLSRDYKLRAGALVNETSAHILTSVFYFARMDSSEWSPTSHRLLYVEIYKTAAKEKILVDRFEINVHDFSWQFRAHAPNGMRTEDFFALQDECLSRAEGDNHYARIELELKGTLDKDPAKNAAGASDWLGVPAKRNMALMKALHEQLSVPPTLFYDIESRYYKASLALKKDKQKGDLIRVSAQAAQRNEAPVLLVYLGKATLQTFAKSKFTAFPTLDFQSCYLIASHKHEDTLFAFYPLTSFCYTLDSQAVNSQNGPEKYFVFEPTLPLEVYRIAHKSDRKLVHDDFITKLDEIDARLMKKTVLMLNDPSGDLRTFWRSDQIKVEHLNEKIAYDVDESYLSDVNKFPGLGLVPEDAQNKLIGPMWETEEDPDTHLATRRQMDMSFEQCQQACLIDLECKSFSTCIVDAQIQCVLSSVDFTTSTMALELMLLQDKKLKFGEISTVITDEPDTSKNSVHLKKHPTCELHNKLYKDLFKYAGLSEVNLQRRYLTPVSHSEQCAELCFKTTVDAMRNQTRWLQAEKVEPKDWRIDDNSSSFVCESYLYLDQRTVDALSLTIVPEQLVARVWHDDIARGYCMLEERSSRRAHPRVSSVVQEPVELRKFKLDFSIMFEKSYGYSLAETSKSDEEESAYREVAYRDNLTPEQLETLRAFIDQGGNTGHRMITNDPADCALRCFAQWTPLWPACRSFDVIEISDKRTAFKQLMCAFNTVTMRQLFALGRNDMVLQDNDPEKCPLGLNEQCHVWHYEPKQGLVASSLEEVFKVDFVRTETMLDRTLQSSGALHLSFLGLLLTICIVAAAGVFAGIQLSARASLDHLMSRAGFGGGGGGGRSQFGEDREVLVESQTRVTFEDMTRVDLPPATADENGTL